MTELNNNPESPIDWDLATWDGTRREALRRWAQLPLENIIAALEEMEELSVMLANSPVSISTPLQPKKVGAVGDNTGDHKSTEVAQSHCEQPLFWAASNPFVLRLSKLKADDVCGHP